MKIILQESYMNLGEAGEIVNVKPGYARNFLIPNRLAVTATGSNLKLFQDKAKEMEKKKLGEREKSQGLVEALKDVSVTLTKKVGDDGKLYGSVGSKDIEEALKQQNFNVDRRMIVLGQQIKMAGEYPILIKLVGGMRTNITLKVVPEANKKI